tara:strand:+ start:7362 stop:10175 length:2814 start_codon:yes stop_codon:yes gene_type:complete
MYSPNIIEPLILDFWKKHKIFQKLVKKNQGKEPFSFIDGPITANNPMGVHHAWGRTYKDAYQRYKAMQGFDQRYQNGFDCQGLWVEVGVEQDLGLNSKKQIEEFGLAKFSEACKARVEKYSKIQEKQSIRLGQWMHWDDSYYTHTDKNIEHIWHFLGKCKKKGWLYESTRVMPWCHRCGTSLSQHELADSYQDLKHTSVFIKAKIKNKNEFFLVWTTTPWTLSSNAALAVNPDLNYVQVQQNNETYYLVEKALKNLKGDYVVLDTFKGKKLLNIEYEPLYNFKPQKFAHKVLPWKEVGEEEGTGIVHIAPGCGAEDNELGKKHKIPEIAPLDEAGNYLENFGFLSKRNVTEVNEDIITDLSERNLLYKTQEYTHRYPVCWRCSTELVFRLVDEWFISSEEIRPLMKKAAKKVTFYPEHASKLMQDWLNNMGDWSISRKRYWGLPLPIWKCKNNHQIFISSKEELKKLAISGMPVKELHRPWIDSVKLKCSKCKEPATRIPEVGDCWLDAGIIPFSTLKYLEDKSYWKHWFPANLVIEMREQIRLWFYSLLFMAVTLEDQPPYENILAYEKVHDEKGKPMHKSWGNAIWFDEAVEKMGADVMRWMYMTAHPQYNLNFGYTPAATHQKALTNLFNLTNYLSQFLKEKPKKPSLELEDKWMLSKLNTTVKEVTDSLDKLKPHQATKNIQSLFTDQISRTYVQFIRSRIQTQTGKNREAAIYTLYESLLTTLKLMAPFTPFLAEHIYQENFRKYESQESIHLMDWPNPEKSEKKLEEEMELVQQINQAILFAREKAKLGLRWPLSSATIITKDKLTKEAVENFSHLIKSQMKLKEIKITSTGSGCEFKTGSVSIDTKLTKELETEGFARELMRHIQNLRKKAGLKREDRISLSIQGPIEISPFEQEIKEVTGTKELTSKDYKEKAEVSIRNKTFKISFEKI